MDAPPRPPIQRLLLVDDDQLMTGILAAALGEEGYVVECVHDGKQALRRCRESPPDLVLLDVQLPEMDGLEVCRRLREHTRLPIILVTSRAEEVDRVTGLDLGADDYVTKPFSTRELCARIRALSRRLEPAAGATGPATPAGYSKASTLLSAEPVRAGDLLLDTARFEARWQGKRVALTRSEFEVLLVLASRRGRVLSREQLLDAVRGDEVVVTDRTVDTFIKRLRKKLRETDPAFDRIETVFGVGYRYRE